MGDHRNVGFVLREIDRLDLDDVERDEVKIDDDVVAKVLNEGDIFELIFVAQCVCSRTFVTSTVRCFNKHNKTWVEDTIGRYHNIIMSKQSTMKFKVSFLYI